MARDSVCSDIDHQAEALVLAALESFERVQDELAPEVVLDFSTVRRIDPAALLAIEQLAAKAEERSVKIVLRGVNVEVYKVLKVTAISAKLSFLN